MLWAGPPTRIPPVTRSLLLTYGLLVSVGMWCIHVGVVLYCIVIVNYYYHTIIHGRPRVENDIASALKIIKKTIEKWKKDR